MKNRISIIISVICMTLFTVLASFTKVFAGYKKDDTLILKEYNGSIALIKGGEIIKYYNEIVISVLPEADREMLYYGIEIENEEQLQNFIEDYDG